MTIADGRLVAFTSQRALEARIGKSSGRTTS
jgi:hypothetical protein